MTFLQFFESVIDFMRIDMVIFGFDFSFLDVFVWSLFASLILRAILGIFEVL